MLLSASLYSTSSTAPVSVILNRVLLVLLLVLPGTINKDSASTTSIYAKEEERVIVSSVVVEVVEEPPSSLLFLAQESIKPKANAKIVGATGSISVVKITIIIRKYLFSLHIPLCNRTFFITTS